MIRYFELVDRLIQHAEKNPEVLEMEILVEREHDEDGIRPNTLDIYEYVNAIGLVFGRN